MSYFAYNFFDVRPSVVTAMTLLRTVHGDNKRRVQLMQLKDGDVVKQESVIGNESYFIIPKDEWLGKDVYFSLNSFRNYHRRANECVRLNALYTDLDCYKIGIDVNEARDMIDDMIANEEILTPNIIIYSGRGLQLIWLMEFMKYENYLTLWERMQTEIYNRFRHLNSDSKAKSVTQIFRLAGSISSRTNGIVRADYLKEIRYSIGEMKEFLLPELPEKIVDISLKVNNVNDEKKKKKSTTHMLTENSLNQARLKDFEKLLEIQPVVNRKNLLFNYAICAKALGTDEKLIERNLERINESFFKPLPSSRVKGAVNSVKQVAYKKRNDTLISELNITLEQQRQLTTIISKEVKKEREQKRKEAQRREKGIKPKEEHFDERRQLSDERTQALFRLLEQQPELKNKELAELLSCSESTVKRMKSKLIGSS